MRGRTDASDRQKGQLTRVHTEHLVVSTVLPTSTGLHDERQTEMMQEERVCPKCGETMYLLGELGSYHWACEGCNHIIVAKGSSRQAVLEYQLREVCYTATEEATLRELLKLRER